MPIDPSISLQLQSPNIGGQFQAGMQNALAMQGQRQSLQLQKQEGDALTAQRQAQAAEQQQKMAEQQRQVTSQQAVDHLMSNAMVQDDKTGVYTLDRPTFESALVKSGNGHLLPQMSESLDKLDASMRQASDQRNTTVAQAIWAVQQSGNTPGALQTAVALLQKNRVIDPDHAKPLLDAADQNGTPEAIGLMMQQLGAGLPQYQALVEAEGKKKSDLATAASVTAKNTAEARKNDAEAQNLENGGKASGPETAPSLQAQHVLLDGKPAIVNYNPKTGQHMNGAEDVSGRVKPIPPRDLVSDTTRAAQTSDVQESVAGMKEGTIPPQLPGRASKDFTAIMAEARRQHYDLSSAVIDWTATQKHLSTMNNAQHAKLAEAVDNTYHSLDVIEDLAKKWDGGKFPILNRAGLAIAKSGAAGEDAQKLAVQLESQIADVTAELGNVYMGGNSPTDHSLELAATNLKADWSKKTLLAMLDQARSNLKIRQNSIKHSPIQGASDANPYVKGQQQADTPPVDHPATTGAFSYADYLKSQKGGK